MRQTLGIGAHIDRVFRVESRMPDGVLLHVMSVAGWDGETIRRLQTHAAAAAEAHVGSFGCVAASSDDAGKRPYPGEVLGVAIGWPDPLWLWEAGAIRPLVGPQNGLAPRTPRARSEQIRGTVAALSARRLSSPGALDHATVSKRVDGRPPATAQ